MSIILNNSEINDYLNEGKFSLAVDKFFELQLVQWPGLKIAYDELKKVQTKTFRIENYKIKTQFNPNRIKSTSARTNISTENNFKCFLCNENLPAEQSGLLLEEKFLLLCNPYPIFPQHFTIASIKHQNQEIKNNFIDFLSLSKKMGQKYSVLYNGPECGASAPFHLHFQAGTKYFLPVENDIQLLKNDFALNVSEKKNILVSFINDNCRRIIFIESPDIEKLMTAFSLIYDLMNEISLTNIEPMINMISSFEEEYGWSLIIFLREKHRPEIFYSNGIDRMLVSPAAVDLGGILILPEQKDFERVDAVKIQNIFNEVSLDEDKFKLLCEKTIKHFN